ncbi:GAF domain-containing protein [Streptomyces sp. R39]|uniref:GAF domain-containing protein n=1 Tax=Streptomyces sp. R39 TaxID=3238631 RepID=A0AB39QGA2_9ACTN
MVTSPESSRVRLPQLRLDELLDELRARVDAARHTRDRVHGLLEAVLAVGGELDLEHVLHIVVDAAAALVDAEYAALGVIGPDGRTLSAFHTAGLTETQIAAIGPCPQGHGIPGEARDPRPLRLTRLGGHQAAYGFPPHHPPVNGFLGVPIRVRDQVFGNLYLTEKRGGAGFGEEDEAIVSALAVAAGMAIDHARLYADSRLRERWLRANADITHSLMSGSPRAETLGLIAERGRDITGSALAALAVPMAETKALTVEIAVGLDAENHRGLVLPLHESLMGLAYTAAAPVASDDIAHDPRISPEPPRFKGLGPAVAVPVGTPEGGTRGVVLLAREAGRAVFARKETELLQAFSAQASLALELAEHRQDAERVALLRDHERIARDLHDLAIQRLFATGMTLQSTGRLITHPEATDRVQRAVDDLDETIKIIRSAIFGLRRHEGATADGLRARVVDSVGEAAPELGFTPVLRIEGLLDTQVPREVADDILAVLAESLTGIARHARASRAQVVLTTDGREVVLTVSDNGAGALDAADAGGLRTMAERAERRGGHLSASRRDDGGTELTWRVPLPAEQEPGG